MNNTSDSLPQNKPRRKISYYQQTTLETCGPSCGLMVLRMYHKVDRMFRAKEHSLYREYHSRSLGKGICGAAMAMMISSFGLHVELFHSEDDYMKNDGAYFEPETFRKFLAEYKDRLSQCPQDLVTARTGVTIDPHLLRQKLDEGKTIILKTLVPGQMDGKPAQILHWVVVYRYEGDTFRVCNPTYGCLPLTSQELEGYMNTPIGKIFLAVDY